MIESTCQHVQPHPPHKWMLGRKLYQCQGVADLMDSSKVLVDREALQRTRVLLERAWAHTNITGAERLRDDLRAALSETTPTTDQR
jgi:hypothetical protein